MSRCTAALLLWLTALASTADSLEPDSQALIGEAQRIAAMFQGRLKPALKTALQEGGPVLAIAVCSARAPQIAREISAETSWQVSRVSLAPRNPAAQPDAWERQQLQRFDESAAKGTAPGFAWSSVEGRFRALQPLPVSGLCLSCHGSDLTPDVVTVLEQLYPEDQARGYHRGQPEHYHCHQPAIQRIHQDWFRPYLALGA